MTAPTKTDGSWGMELPNPLFSGDPWGATDTEATATSSAEASQGSPVDEDAPFGRNPKTGKPYTMSEEDRAERGRVLAEARAAARDRKPDNRGARPASAPRLATSKTSKGAQPKVTTYAQTASVLLSLPAAALAMASRFVPSLALDALAVKLHTPTIAVAVGDLAEQNTAIADALDRITKASPYGALFAAVMPLVMQIAANHGVLGTNNELGILDPETLVGKVTGDENTD